MNTTPFALKAFLFCIPPALLVLFPFFVLIISGELTPITKRIALQQASERELLLTKSYYPFPEDIRLETYRTLWPDITILGNSRVYQFRREFFSGDTRFYAAADFGVGLRRIFNEFFTLTDGGSDPNIILIGLEQSMFIESYEEKPPPEEPNALLIIRRVYGDYWSKKFSLRDIVGGRLTSDSLGIRALVVRAGTRKDGSERYGAVIENPHDPAYWDYAFLGTFERIDIEHPLFRYGADLSPVFLSELTAFLDEAKRRGVHVVAFLPPYAPSVFAYMQSKGDAYAYIPKIYPAIRKEFTKRGFSLFDFTDATALGSSDEEFLDGNHGSEKSTARMLLTMAASDSELARVTDFPGLTEALKSATSNLELFK